MTLKERLYSEYRTAYTKWYALDQEAKANPGIGRAVAIAHKKDEALAVLVVIERCMTKPSKAVLREIEMEVINEYWLAVEEKTREEEEE